ncbi:hypothetical protein ABPG73_021456 [Tetrahymena malaccensis]
MTKQLPKTREENRKIVDKDVDFDKASLDIETKQKLNNNILQYVNKYSNLKLGKCYSENWYDEYTHVGQYDNNSRLLKAHAHYITHQINEEYFKSNKQFSLKQVLLLQQRLLFALQLRNIGDIIYLTLKKNIPQNSIQQHQYFNDQLSDTSAILDEVIKTCNESGILDNLQGEDLILYEILNNNIKEMRDQDSQIQQQLDSAHIFGAICNNAFNSQQKRDQDSNIFGAICNNVFNGQSKKQ